MKIWVLSLVVICVLLYSCKNSEETERFEEMQESIMNKDEYKPQKSCYQAIVGKDTATLFLTFVGMEVSGTLNYNHFEKDDNTGQLKGIREGDTIKLEYNFMSEGDTSLTDKYFLIKGEQLLEATGNMYQQYSWREVYANPLELKYGESFIYDKVDCN